jgi:hypothetical protein
MPATQLTLKALEEYIFSNASYTLTSQTALQKLFNSTANGAVAVEANTSYFFQCRFDLSAMSATSGNFGFGFLGTSTIASIAYTANASKSAIGTPTASLLTTAKVTTSTGLVVANVATTGHVTIQGIIRTTLGGTLIPSVSLGIAAAAIVGINSYFRIVTIGSNTQTNIGPWT